MPAMHFELRQTVRKLDLEYREILQQRDDADHDNHDLHDLPHACLDWQPLHEPQDEYDNEERYQDADQYRGAHINLQSHACCVV